ncbi:YwiC-like family protein [Arcanobacterium buesumense]|uniref:YwiC-like family protein n=2 Tax=Arcanobacterium buesumense TaxID=2722751 RepID=A0A6H2EJ09_9ACTO|nr:YwiC-like family protein [Arcanobacterium buesumense]
MIIIPPILGIVAGGFNWRHVLLLALWWLGYFDFFAIGLWLRSRRKKRFLPPVISYTIPCLILGVSLALTAPHLLVWVPIFLPLIVITFWQSAIRADRSMLNDTVTVLAASLLLPVSYQVSMAGDPPVTPHHMWLMTTLVFGYFLGTVFYVKTNIRQRANRSWLVLSVIWHLLFTSLSALASTGFWFADDEQLSTWHTLVWLVLTIRAWAVPTWGERHGWVSAKILGIGEIIASIAVTVTLLG